MLRKVDKLSSKDKVGEAMDKLHQWSLKWHQQNLEENSHFLLSCNPFFCFYFLKYILFKKKKNEFDWVGYVILMGSTCMIRFMGICSGKQCTSDPGDQGCYCNSQPYVDVSPLSYT